MEQLNANKKLLSKDEYALCKELCLNYNQSHCFSFWDDLGKNDDKKVSLVKQLVRLNKSYPHGLSTYVTNSKRLLVNSRDGVNPFAGFTPSVPVGEKVPLEPGTKENVSRFIDFERIGLSEVSGICFVIVAGGLGERLGYSGIKLALPCEILTGTSFLQLYIENMISLQNEYKEQTGNSVEIPLAIMTSDDTHDLTVKHFEANNYFGMKKSQIDLMKQEKVPAITSNDGEFEINEKSYEIITKPHGHGDVHSLLHSTGVAGKWKDKGKKYLMFIQDTNILVFKGLMASLGVSKKLNLAMNSVSIPRNDGEPIGAICRLINEKDGEELTINVEYNQLDALIKGSGVQLPDKEPGDKRSPFPGNNNVLLFQLESYVEVLKISKGAVPEFVNPKYADEARTAFKKATRLECMMQDFPRLMRLPSVIKVIGENNLKIGFTMLDRFTCYSAAKNNLKDAEIKREKTGHAGSMASAEHALYKHGVKAFNLLGAHVEPGAKILIKPSFATSLAHMQDRLKSPGKIKISSRSSLVLDGDISLKELVLNGALSIRAEEKAEIVINSLKVENKGLEFIDLDGSEPEAIAIRGYKLKMSEQKEIIAKKNEKLIV